MTCADWLMEHAAALAPLPPERREQLWRLLERGCADPDGDESDGIVYLSEHADARRACDAIVGICSQAARGVRRVLHGQVNYYLRACVTPEEKREALESWGWTQAEWSRCCREVKADLTGIPEDRIP